VPNLNGKGPTGEGPLTGRKMGNCKKSSGSKEETAEKQEGENTITKANEIIYGLGRGGRPFGGGGNGFGNRNRNRNGNGRGFRGNRGGGRGRGRNN